MSIVHFTHCHLSFWSMCVVFCRFIYETEKHSGIAELLEILGRSVFSGCTCSNIKYQESLYQFEEHMLVTGVGRVNYACQLRDLGLWFMAEETSAPYM